MHDVPLRPVPGYGHVAFLEKRPPELCIVLVGNDSDVNSDAEILFQSSQVLLGTERFAFQAEVVKLFDEFGEGNPAPAQKRDIG